MLIHHLPWYLITLFYPASISIMFLCFEAHLSTELQTWLNRSHLLSGLSIVFGLASGCFGIIEACRFYGDFTTAFLWSFVWISLWLIVLYQLLKKLIWPVLLALPLGFTLSLYYFVYLM